MKKLKMSGIIGIVLTLILCLIAAPGVSAQSAKGPNSVLVMPESANIGDTVYLDGLFEAEAGDSWGNVYLSPDNLTYFEGASLDELESYSKVGTGGLIPRASSMDPGHFTAEFIVPSELADTDVLHSVTSGFYSIYLTRTSLTTGIESPILSKSALTIIVSDAKISLESASGPHNSDVWVNGADFAGLMTLKFNIDGIPIPIKSGDSAATMLGSFRSLITIPYTFAPGEHAISVVAGSRTASATYTILTDTKLDPLSSSSAPPGASITVSGSGFPANSQLTITLDDIPISPLTGIVYTDGAGSFSSVIAVPANTTLGAHTLKAGANYPLSARSTVFTVTSGAFLFAFSPGEGAAGSPVVVSGTALPANKPLAITFDGAEVTPTAGSSITNGAGGFTSTINIPETAAAGEHTISVTADPVKVSGAFLVTGTAVFTPSIEPLSPASGTAGTAVVVSGSGYPADAALTFLFGDISVTPALGDTTTDSGGEFQSVITVPPAAPAGVTAVSVTASDSMAEAFFSVIPPQEPTDTPPETAQPTTTAPTTTPPVTPEPTTEPAPATVAAPQALQPASGAIVKSNASFKWEDTADSYNLQISADLNFTAVLIDKTGLGVSEYTLTGDEMALLTGNPGTYYWRVKAADNAGTSSGWSNVSSFSTESKGFPVWATIIIIIAIILAVVIAGVFIFRRGKGKPNTR